MSDVLKMPDASAETLMGEVVDEFLERLGAGERPEIEEYVERYPQLAAVLRHMLPAVQAVHLSAADQSETERAVAPIEPEGPLGDFRIVRQIGRGGMGIVYEAVQISLGRRVALKVLPFAAALDAKQLQRFRNEAQAAALLHHQSIVPVYYVGCERGVHFYAMQFIQGRTLAQVIDDLRSASAKEMGRMGNPSQNISARPAPAPDTLAVAALSTERMTGRAELFRTIARLGVQAAEALEHAHQEGIIHRDIKPANLLVDTKGNLWITDFGLARLRNDTSLTVSGDLVGTLRYMSPEQALGHPATVDHRTDVYSLGATLYELASLCPVFEGCDRQALLRRIAVEDPLPPRRLNRPLPVELEIIIQKAMEKDPSARYATAQELADDLRRFLEDKPIRARRPSWLEQARKWARRHRPVVWSAVVSLFVALTVLAGSVGWVVRDQAARHAKIVSDLQTAVEEAEWSQKHGQWPQALAAARRAEGLLRDGAHQPELDARVRRLLRELAQEEADRRLVPRLEEIRVLQAEVNAKEDRFFLERALPEYRQAFKDYGLPPEAIAPDEAAAVIRRRPAATHGAIVAALDYWLILARREKASEADWLERVLSTADSDPWRQRLRTARTKGDRQTLEQLAREVDFATQPAEALLLLNHSLAQTGALQEAVALLRRAHEAFPNNFWINHDLGVKLRDLPPPQHDEAIRFLTAAVALRPDSAAVRLNLGVALSAKGRLDEAVVAFRKATELKPDFARAHVVLGSALSQQGRLDDAITAVRGAIAVKPNYAYAHSRLGFLLGQKGRFDDAAAAFRKAIELEPKDAVAHYNLGNLLANNGHLADAAAAYRRAIDEKSDYAEAHCNLGVALRRQGDFSGALAALKRGHELGVKRQDWHYPSARWVTECQGLRELEDRLPAILRGEAQPRTVEECNAYALLCYEQKRYVAAARWRANAMAADAKLADDVEAGYRYEAACAAALAGGGEGTDAGQLDAVERVRWRTQALAWLRADLAAFANRLEKGGAKDRRLVQQRLSSWQGQKHLAGLRDAVALAKLPDDERQACNQFWTEVRTLLTKTRAAQQQVVVR